jgi:hypothetical protein
MSAEVTRGAEVTEAIKSLSATKSCLAQISLACALFFFGLLLYWPSLNGPELFDDEVMLSNATPHASIAEMISSLDWLRPETRPVVRLTFGLETEFFGESMSVHRMGNLLVHVLAAMALFGLVRRVSEQIEKGHAGSSFSIADQTAWAVSLLWFVHPLQSAAVAYVAQRGESLMGFFFFLYLRCLVESIVTRKTGWTFVAIAVFCLGLFSKTIMITAPLVGLLLHRAFFSRTWREVFRQQWGVMLVPAAGSVMAVGLLLPGILKGHANVGFGGDAPPVALHLAAQAKVFWLYAMQCIWPQWLCVDHGLRPPQFAADHFGWILATILFLSVAVLLCWRQKWIAGFFLLAPIFVLAMTSSVIPTADLWVDHRMYVPLAFVVTFLVFGLQRLFLRLHGSRQASRGFPVIIGILCVLLSARTYSRAADYASGIQMWQSAIQENPDNDRAIQNLIDAVRDESPESSIVPVLNEALNACEERGIIPTVVLGRIGEQFAQSGESDKAIKVLSQAIQLDDQHFFTGYRGPRRNGERFGMQINMGLALASLGQLPDALKQIGEAFLYSDSADARALAGSLALQLGDTTLARGHFERALELRPGWKDVEADLERLRQLQ